MENGRSVEQTGKWLFHLQHEHSLQLRITSLQEAGDHMLIEGHEISELLDYLYDHRDLIYEATHDQERRRTEALEASARSSVKRREKRRVEPTRYFDDGMQRIKATPERF
jgi:hypothetical protein